MLYTKFIACVLRRPTPSGFQEPQRDHAPCFLAKATLPVQPVFLCVTLVNIIIQ